MKYLVSGRRLRSPISNCNLEDKSTRFYNINNKSDSKKKVVGTIYKQEPPTSFFLLSLEKKWVDTVQWKGVTYKTCNLFLSLSSYFLFPCSTLLDGVDSSPGFHCRTREGPW